MSLLQISGLHKRYGTVAALDGVSLEIAAGSRTAVVGPSGSGKTTLLRLIAGFDVPDAGRISMDGQVLADGGAALPAHRRGIGVVAQDGALFPHLTIADNIGFGLGKDADRAGRIRTLMAMVELDGAMADRKPDQLSGGQQQRVALARALARQPQLILLDEPFSALDTGLRAATRKAVAEVLGAAGVTTVLVTHDQAEALSFADQVAVMRDGRLVQVGDPRAVYRRPVDAVTAEFLGDAVILTARISGGLADCALGRIAVDDSSFKGDADILLRPEQILLATAVAGGTGSPVQADIVAVDFCGSTCDLDVRLVDHRPEPFRPATGRAQPQTVKLRQSSHMMITTGMLMDISISGPAHILEG